MKIDNVFLVAIAAIVSVDTDYSRGILLKTSTYYFKFLRSALVYKKNEDYSCKYIDLKTGQKYSEIGGTHGRNVDDIIIHPNYSIMPFRELINKLNEENKIVKIKVKDSMSKRKILNIFK